QRRKAIQLGRVFVEDPPAEFVGELSRECALGVIEIPMQEISCETQRLLCLEDVHDLEQVLGVIGFFEGLAGEADVIENIFRGKPPEPWGGGTKGLEVLVQPPDGVSRPGVATFAEDD